MELRCSCCGDPIEYGQFCSPKCEEELYDYWNKVRRRVRTEEES